MERQQRLRGDLANHVDALGLRRPVERLGRLIEEFRVELGKTNAKGVTFDQIRAARTALHERTCDVVTAVLYHFAGDDEDVQRARTKILAPLDYQQARVIEARKRRRQVTDVNPETGEEILDEVAEPVDLEPAEA